MTIRSLAVAFSLVLALASAGLATAGLAPASLAQTAAAQTAPQNDPPQYSDEDFARDVQKAVGAGDAAWLADRARYPVKVFGKRILVIRNKKAFVASASSFLGPKLKAAVLAQKPDELFRNYQGVMIGQIQNIWFYNFGEGGEKNDFRIITINGD